MASERITVVDLGTSRVACLTVERVEGGGLRPIDFVAGESAGMHRGAISDAKALGTALSAVLDQCKHGRPDRIALSFGGPNITTEFRRGLHPIVPTEREVTRADVLWAIQHSRAVPPKEGSERIQTLPCYFRLDGKQRTQHPIGQKASRIEVATLLVNAETERVHQLEQVAAHSGCVIDLGVYQPLASGFAVLSEEEAEIGTAVVEIGAGCTQIAVFRETVPVVCGYLPIGGQVLTSDIGKLLNASSTESERLKLASGIALASLVDPEETVDVFQLGQTQPRVFQRRVLCEILEARVRELGSAIGQFLAKSGLWEELEGGIVLTGGGSKLAGMDVAIEAASGIKTRRGQVIGVSGSKTLASIENCVLMGAARLAGSPQEDDLEPIGGSSTWRDRVRTLWALRS